MSRLRVLLFMLVAGCLSLTGVSTALAVELAPQRVMSIRPATAQADIGSKPRQVFPSLKARMKPTGSNAKRIIAQSKVTMVRAGSITRSATASEPLIVTHKDCQVNRVSTGDRGFVVDHFNYCSVGTWLLSYSECVNGKCKVIGDGSFRMTVLGRTAAGARDANFYVLTDRWTYSHSIEKIPLTVGMICRSQGSAICTDDLQKEQTKTVAAWAVGPQLSEFRFSSLYTGSQGLDHLSYHNFYTSVQFGNLVYDYLNGFRCDSAKYLAGKQGVASSIR